MVFFLGKLDGSRAIILIGKHYIYIVTVSCILISNVLRMRNYNKWSPHFTLPISYTFAVQTDDGFDKGGMKRCTLAYGAKVLPTCSRDENGHGKHESTGAFHAGRYSKVVEMLHPHSGDSYF